MADNASHLKESNIRRGIIKRQLTSFKKFLDTLDDPSEAEVAQLRIRLDKLKILHDEFNKIQSDIETMEPTEGQFREREDVDTTFFELMAHGTTMLDRAACSAPSMTDSMTATTRRVRTIKLPVIPLPKFEGTYDGWLDFRDTFTTLIHDNEELTAVQKLHYLKSSLLGDAQKVIKALETTASNYAVAWKLVNERYENRRLIVGTHVAALFNLAPLKTEGALGLRKLVDDINTHIRALRSLNQPTEHWDALLIHLITGKLDSKSIKEWETTRVDDTLPTMTELMAFLTQRCRTLESVEAARGGNTGTSRHLNESHKGQRHTRDSTEPTVNRKRKWTQAFVATRTASRCQLCNLNHELYRCNEFNDMEVAKRIAYVRSSKLCINCLRPGHKAVECKSGTCLKCNKRHNTKLHLPGNDKRTQESKNEAAMKGGEGTVTHSS